MNIKQLTQIDYDYIDMLLKQADDSGVKREMCESVTELLKTNPGMNIIEAYESAFRWCLPDSSIDRKA